MAKRDYYEVLGVSKSASKDEIKQMMAMLRASILILALVRFWVAIYIPPNTGNQIIKDKMGKSKFIKT